MNPSPPFRWLKQIAGIVAFAAWYLVAVLIANLRVAAIVLSPRPRFRPALVALPLPSSWADRRVFAAAALLTMTPGTLSVAVSADRSVLFVHALTGGEDLPELRRSLEQFLWRIERAC